MESRRRFLKRASFAAVPVLLTGQSYGEENPTHVKSLGKYNVIYSPDFDPDELVVIGQVTKKLAGHTGDDFVRALGLSFEKMKPEHGVASRYRGNTPKLAIKPEIETYGFSVTSEIEPNAPYSPPYTVKIAPKEVIDAVFWEDDSFLTTVSLSELQVIGTFFGFGEELLRLKNVSGGPLHAGGLRHPFAIEFVEKLNAMREEFISNKGLGVYPYANMMRHLNEINARDGFGAVGLYAIWDETLTTKRLGKGFKEAVESVESFFRSIKKG